MDNEVIRYHLGGSEFISIDTLQKQLTSLKSNLESLSESILGDKDKISIVVKPFKRGSFDIEMIVQYAASFIVPAIQIGLGLIQCIQARKMLKGQEPKSVTFVKETNKYNVEIHNGDNINITKEVYEAMTKNKTLEKNTSAQFRSLDKDLSRTDIEISVESNGNVVSERIDKEQLAFLAKPLDLSKYALSPRESISTIWLTVGRVDFQGSEKGTFLDYNGNEISVEICDSKYLSKLTSGELSFKSKTRLYVKLKTTETQIPSGKIIYEHQIVEVLTIDSGDHSEQLTIA